MTATDPFAPPIKIGSILKKEKKVRENLLAEIQQRYQQNELLSVTTHSQRVPFQLIQDNDNVIRIKQVDRWYQGTTGVKVGQRVAMLQDRDIESYQDLDEIQAVLQETLDINLVVVSKKRKKKKRRLSNQMVSSTDTQLPCVPEEDIFTITDALKTAQQSEPRSDISPPTLKSETNAFSKNLIYANDEDLDLDNSECSSNEDSSEDHILDQSQLQMQKESVASLESKVRTQEEQIAMYKGMYEDVQEDYNELFGEYNDQVEQFAIMYNMMKRMEVRLGRYENALHEKADRIDQMKEQISTLQHTENYQSLEKLKAENKRLQELNRRQKQSLFEVLAH